jgi:hypothetical protein
MNWWELRNFPPRVDNPLCSSFFLDYRIKQLVSSFFYNLSWAGQGRAAMPSDDVGTGFVRLGLSINQHFTGYVDAYFGPEEIAREVKSVGKAPITDLEPIADQLSTSVASDQTIQSARQQYLLAELAAMRTTLRILKEETLAIADEVRLLYGIEPAWVSETTFAEAHRALASILPGDAPLPKRIEAFRENTRLPVQVAASVINRLASDLRDRTYTQFRLPKHETCEFLLVHDKPWAAYNWYMGGSHSRVEVNEDRPIQIGQLPYLVAHEVYPGHHTEHAIKEERLYRGEGLLEHAILLSNTPSALVSEGIAENALDILADRDEVIGMYRDILRSSGLPEKEAPRLYDFVLASRPLLKVCGNQLLLLYEQGVSDNEVIAYGMRYALTTESLEKQLMEFAKHPLWRSYGFNYTYGYEAVKAFLDAAPDKPEALGRLLQDAITPGQLMLLDAE